MSIGLDVFDASINRVAAWIIGIRATQKALLEPSKRLREAEDDGNHTARLALLEEAKAMPWGAVWGEFCHRNNAPRRRGVVGRSRRLRTRDGSQ